MRFVAGVPNDGGRVVPGLPGLGDRGPSRPGRALADDQVPWVGGHADGTKQDANIDANLLVCVFLYNIMFKKECTAMHKKQYMISETFD